jgi:adenylate cyclase
VAEQPTGKLAVILHADVVGSTALVQRDERRAHERITSAFKRFSQTIQEYGGQVHEIRGDALVAEFSRASDAACAAMVFQKGNSAHNERLDDDFIPEVRIGISLGEVVIADNTITGAGVVLAQRIEQLAEPGGICITEAIREATPERLPLANENLGEQQLKGFEQPVHVHAVRLQSGAEVPPPEPRQAPKRRRTRMLATAAAAAFVVAIALAWLTPWQPETELAPVDRLAYALPSEPSIAVLPFANLSGDPEQDYFVDGFTNEIITNLSKFPEFFVIASNSVFTYKGKAVRVNEVGRELGVRYLLEGSLQRSADKLSVRAQLIEAANEKQLWAEQYDVAPQEIFAVQRGLTQQIASTLASKVLDLAQTAVSKKDETNLPAYELYLKGSKFRFGKESFEESVRLLERAIELDPDSAAAYATLSRRYLRLWRQRLADDPDEALRRARSAARKAVTLDQQDYRSRLSLAEIYLWADKDYDFAIAEFQKTIALNPNNADVMSMMSLALAFVGRANEAVEWTEKATRLNPYHPVWYNWNGSFAYYMARDYEKALLGAKKTLTIYPKSLSVLRILAATYVEMGDMEKAGKMAQKILEIDPEFTLSGMLNVPLKDKADRERYFGALAKAGLPE